MNPLSNRAEVVLTQDIAKIQDGVLSLCPHKNLRNGVSDFEGVFPSVTSLEVDLFNLSSAVYACDLAFKRGQREHFTREITLTVPVVNLHAFERVKEDLQYILYVLSNDCWNVNFVSAPGQPESVTKAGPEDGMCLLFSGGLDSLSAALDLTNKFGADKVVFCSHQTANPVTKSSQDNLARCIGEHFGSISTRVIVRTGGRNVGDWFFPIDKDREETQRTRSFMFASIAALAARRRGITKVVTVAENGQMAIHLPLSAARIGAFSTHTAHPEFLQMIGKFFSNLLTCDVSFVNPYVYLTKAEVIRDVIGAHPAWIPFSVSCWRGSRISGGLNHCGECVPCLVRRIALEANNVSLEEYECNLFEKEISNLPADNEGKRNLVELLEFVQLFSTESDASIEHSFPELMNEHFDRKEVIAMYRRFSKEATLVAQKYRGVADLISGPSPTDTKQSKKTRK